MTSIFDETNHINIFGLSHALNTWDFLPYRRTIDLDKRDDGLSSKENVTGSVIGTCVDSLTRFMSLEDRSGFERGLSGSKAIDRALGIEEHYNKAVESLYKINGLDDESIINACKLAYYEGYGWMTYKDLYSQARIINPYSIVIKEPDPNTISNIRKLVNRNLQYLKGRHVTEFGFGSGGVNSKGVLIHGDGDALLDDCILDFKCLRGNIDNSHLRQLLIYLWGLPGEKKDKITKLHIYNARKNKLTYILLKDIPKDYLEGFFKAVDNFEG